MDRIVIEGVRPYDGRYELDLGGAPLTVREWGWVKRHTGYLPVTLDENTFTDPEMITMLALIALRRAGTITVAQVGEVWDRFADAPFGSAITFEADPAADREEDDAGPPASSSNGNGPSSGDGSATSSAISGWPTLASSGTPASAISASTSSRSGS
jgi:hypothetical protein